jgi:hypothetical protein
MKRALVSTAVSFAAAILLALALGGTAMAQSATVMTDRADYAPGEIVTITGSGWQPGETVTLQLVESPLIDTHPDLTAVADANGNIFNNQFSPDSHDVNVSFTLTATGGASGLQAQTTFTDSINSISITSSPFSIAVNSCSAAITLGCTGNGSLISLSSSSAGGKFYASATNCSSQTTPITTDGSTCSAGTAPSIFYRDNIAGNPTITISANSNTAPQTETIYGPATTLSVTGFPSPVTAGTSNSFTVTARDANGNVAAGYTGTVKFASTDGQAVLPANYTFVAGDNGTHTFSATLKTAGTQSITATDTVTASITGTQSGILVNAAIVRRGQTIVATLSPMDRYAVRGTALDNL